MKSGQGRLILRDGTDLPITYRLVHNDYGSWCSGTLIGDIRSVDPGSFSQGMRARLENGHHIVLLVTAYSDRHLSFVAKFDGSAARGPSVFTPG